MMLNAIGNTLKQFHLFSGLTESEVNTLTASGKYHQYDRGEALFHHGDPVTQFYLVITGNVQLFRETPDGNEKTIEIIKSGQSICENEIMDACVNHRVNAVAVDEVTLVAFPVTWLKNAAKNHSALALNLLSMISKQVHLAEIEAEHQATMSAAQLVACFLQRLCVLYDLSPSGFDLPYSKTLIASRLGMELETFSRTLLKLKEQGISVSGTRVVIQNLKRIEHYVCEFCSIADHCPTHQAMEQKIGN